MDLENILEWYISEHLREAKIFSYLDKDKPSHANN